MKICFEKDRVAALMEQNGLNPSSFSRRINRSPQLVQQWLEGKCLPGTKSIEVMCNEFSLSPAYFFVEKNVCAHEAS